MSVPTISREVHQNSFNKNMLIKKNIFGHKWVLKINEKEKDPKKKRKRKLIVFAYILVFLSILLAVCFGIIFSIDHNIFRAENKNTPDQSNDKTLEVRAEDNISVFDTRKNRSSEKWFPILINKSNKKSSLSDDTKETIQIKNLEHSKNEVNATKSYCQNCTKYQVCIKMEETGKPACVDMIDRRDRTGCGGLCKINTEYCKNLDKSSNVYQCLRLKNLLKCPDKLFNCGNMCISMEKRCDGQIECSNMKDEENCACNIDTHFQCGNQTSCLDRKKLCNGKVDCWDKSDELHCKKGIYCQENHIQCLNGQCIPKEKMCDKVIDCLDRTDEPIWCQQIRH